MRLSQTRRHWNRLAQADPLWVVLTEKGKENNGWQIDEFFANGRRIVDDELAGVRAHHPALRYGAALDFGCGVGRLSQALAGHFDTVTGVDISEEMLAHARRYNTHGHRVRYLHNSHSDLRLLASNQFDFVYSLITLQHMEPVYARRYINEFARVAAPGGVILFQIPSESYQDPPDRTLLTLWFPTFWKRFKRRMRRWLNLWFAFEPFMEMHAIPRQEVEAVLRATGLEILVVYKYGATGSEIESWGYLARKP